MFSQKDTCTKIGKNIVFMGHPTNSKTDCCSSKTVNLKSFQRFWDNNIQVIRCLVAEAKNE